MTEAVVFTGVDTVAMQTIAMPPPGHDQVQVRTTCSTISAGTESWVLQNRFTWSATPFPCVPGYQRAGQVTAVGAGVTDWQVGDRCLATCGAFDGAVHSFWGAHLAIGNSPVHEVYRLPGNVHDIDASGAVVANVGVNAASRLTGLERGAFVVVFGDGLIGQLGAQAARARGARVILVGHRAARLAVGLEHSADFVVNSATERVADAVAAITGGQPVHAVIDTIQTIEAQREYVDLLQPMSGQVVFSGFSPGTSWSDQAQLHIRQLTTHYISGWTRQRLEQTIDLMAAGRIRVRPLISHRVPFSQAPAMYDMIRHKTEPFMGICLDWTGAGPANS